MNTFKSENGLKIHVGKTHRKETSTTTTPDPPRHQTGGSVSLIASPLLEVTWEELAMVDPGEPDHPHPDWVSCPRSECWVKKKSVEIEILSKRPCNICGAKHQDDCDCNSCFSCDTNGICCNKCPCCDSRHEEITEKEWSAYIHDRLNVSSGRKKERSKNISAGH